MKQQFILLSTLIIFFSLAFSSQAESKIDNLLSDEKFFNLINESVFEVVVKKPEKDSLSYEKTLPMELIPYSIRTDKYYSIGTAFAIDSDNLVSAAHVMNLGFESQYGEIFLRDKEGNVYQIDKIIKYSDDRDFVVFTLKNRKIKFYLEVNTKPKIGQRVYAVGNALGEGIVVRDGLYTSDTPEEEDGKWKWIRFSAAASPGNSGGPLLDKDGRVIGVILGRSKNENLNYALPISEVLEAEMNKAISHKKVKYVLDNMDITELGTFDREIKLPKSFNELNEELIRSYREFSIDLLKKFLSKNRDNIFPHSKASANLLYSTYSAVFPHIIMKGEDGNWDAFYPSDVKSSEIGNNGYIRFGGMINTLFLFIRRPDNIPIERFYSDSKLLMDLVLKGVYLYREIGGEKIKITSFGKAAEERTFKDSFARKWLVRTWLLEYSDEKIVAFFLPVPGGIAGIVKIGQTELVNGGYIPNMEVLADFIYVSYYGNLEQWTEFLKMKDILPDLFSEIEISFSYGKEFNYKSKRFSFFYRNEIMNISPKSDLKVLTGYFKEKDKVVWDVKGIIVGEDINRNTAIGIFKKERPAPELNDSFQSEWDSIVNKTFPYNSSSFYKEGITAIKKVHPGIPGSTIAYILSYEREGNIEGKEMAEKLEIFDRGLKTFE